MMHCWHEELREHGDLRESLKIKYYKCCWCAKEVREQGVRQQLPGHGPHSGIIVNGNPFNKEHCPNRPDMGSHH